MRGRQPEKFQLKPKDKVYLRQLLQDGKTPWRVARRAQILLQRADPEQQVGSLSKKFAQSTSTIWRICQRYGDEGLDAALYDAPRSGRPPVFPRRQRKAIERLAQCEPESVDRYATHWSFRSLAEATVEQGYVDTIAHTTVRKILYAAKLRLPRFRFWKTTIWDEEAVARAFKILWYYERIESLWQRGEVLLALDEKPNLQVLERAHPKQPMRPGHIE